MPTSIAYNSRYAPARNENMSRVSSNIQAYDDEKTSTDDKYERYEIEELDHEEYYYVDSSNRITTQMPRRHPSVETITITTTIPPDQREFRYSDEKTNESEHSYNSHDNFRSVTKQKSLGYSERPTTDPAFIDHRTRCIRSNRGEESILGANSCTPTDESRRFQRNGVRMSIDYTPNDFKKSRAIIDAAAREPRSVNVEQRGNTTIMTEQRDPYSFYWQLDQIKPVVEEPKRRRPQADYVVDEEIVSDVVLSPDSHDSGVNVENIASQYSKLMRVSDSTPPMKPLPSGWEKHEDPSGFSYYWHVDSGTIQRDYPVGDPPKSVPINVMQNRETPPGGHPTSAAPTQQTFQLPSPQPLIEERAFKHTTTKRCVDNDISDYEDEQTDMLPVRFAVRSLGWTEISEEDLTPEKSSREVNRAIVDLSTGRNDVMDNVSKWGDGRELIMELNSNDLILSDPDSMNVVHKVRIEQIRVWGVGRDNGRDFAYVSRDRSSGRFLCHVFRCDTPAKTIANALRDICQRKMFQERPNSLNTVIPGERRLISRDTYLPTPIEEPKKTIRCYFLGVTQVPMATGIEVLNEAVDRLFTQVRPDRWILVDVSIAPSTVTIVEVNGNQIAQCRVRYLSFLGIGRDVKHCAFIMHNSSENFMCYVFHVEPSAGPMAKTIEAACKLRYQKVLDAHGNNTRVQTIEKQKGQSSKRSK